jgi:hypothetical protein
MLLPFDGSPLVFLPVSDVKLRQHEREHVSCYRLQCVVAGIKEN